MRTKLYTYANGEGYLRLAKTMARRFYELNGEFVHILDTAEFNFLHPRPKDDMWIKAFLWDIITTTPDVERIVFIDADIYPLQPLPNLPTVAFLAREDVQWVADRARKERSEFSKLTSYFNAGFFIATREAIPAFNKLKEYMTIPHQGVAIPDQTFFNLAVQETLGSFTPIPRDLALIWGEPLTPDTAMIHYAGKPMGDRMANFGKLCLPERIRESSVAGIPQIHTPTSGEHLLAVVRLAQQLEPTTIMEIYTCGGYTARALAMNTHSRVDTYDTCREIQQELKLPYDDYVLPRERIGHAFRGEHWDIRSFIASEADIAVQAPQNGPYDFVYIDGGPHTFEATRRHTRLALSACTKHARLVWDDYNTTFKEVMDLLNWFNQQAEVGIKYVEGTRIAFVDLNPEKWFRLTHLIDHSIAKEKNVPVRKTKSCCGG